MNEEYEMIDERTMDFFCFMIAEYAMRNRYAAQALSNLFLINTLGRGAALQSDGEAKLLKLAEMMIDYIGDWDEEPSPDEA